MFFDLIENEKDDEILIDDLREKINNRSIFNIHRKKFVKIYIKDFGFVDTFVNVDIISYAKLLNKDKTYNFLKKLKAKLRGIKTPRDRSRSRSR